MDTSDEALEKESMSLHNGVRVLGYGHMNILKALRSIRDAERARCAGKARAKKHPVGTICSSCVQCTTAEEIATAIEEADNANG